ncbi:MAG: hypothetical protein AABY64_13375 [Bdellovibrionota bacterium]
MNPMKVIFAILAFVSSTSMALETDTSSCGDVKLNLATTTNAVMCVISQVSATVTNLGGMSTSAGGTSSSTSSNSTSTRPEIMKQASSRVSPLLNPETTEEQIQQTLKDPMVRNAFLIIHADPTLTPGPSNLRELTHRVMYEASL